MKKRIFSPRLYLDGIKQLRIIGILSTVALTFIGVITPFMRYLDTLDDVITEFTANSVNYLEMNLPIFLLFCAIAPLMTLYLFSFLNKRDSSDFYHSIPETRQCIFLSFFAAIVTWLLFITVVSGTVITLSYAVLPHLYTVNLSSVLLVSFNAFSGALLIAASVAIAMSVTGTVFSNVLVSLLLIFLPRMLIHIAVTAVSDALPLVHDLSFASVLNYEYNVPVGFVFGLLFGNYERALAGSFSGVYTLIIALIFTVLALFLFTKRNSESAGQSAPNSFLQAVYRFLIGSVLTSVMVYGLFDTVAQDESLDASMMGTLFLLFAVSVLLALAFQVITSHSFRRLHKYAVSTIVSLLVFVGVYFGGIYGLYHATASFSPATDEIDSVRILNDSIYYRAEEYFSAKTEKIEITNKEARRIVSDQLAYSLNLLETSRDRYWQSDLLTVPVAIKSGGTTHLRNIRMSQEQLSAIYDTVADTEDFRAVYMDLPQTISSVYANERCSMDSAEENAVYQALVKEVQAIGFDKWFAIQSSMGDRYEDYAYTDPGNNSSVLTHLTFRLYEGMQWYELRVPLDITVFPKTAQEYLQANEQLDDVSGLIANIKKEGSLDKHDYLEIRFFNFDGDEPFGSVYLNEEIMSHAGDIQSFVASLTDTETIDTTKPFYSIHYEDVTQMYEENGKDYWSEYTDYLCYCQGDTLPEWLLNLYSDAKITFS